MRVVVIGATRGVGRLAAAQARDAGHQVRAFARSIPDADLRLPGVEYVSGDVTDIRSLGAALPDCDAVITALDADDRANPTLYSTAAGNLSLAMSALGIGRLIFLSNFGVQDERSYHPLTAALLAITGKAIAGTLRDHKAALARLRASQLSWTAVRPMTLTNGDRRGTYRVANDNQLPFGGLRISRADVAHFMVGQLSDRSFSGLAPSIAY